MPNKILFVYPESFSVSGCGHVIPGMNVGSSGQQGAEASKGGLGWIIAIVIGLATLISYCDGKSPEAPSSVVTAVPEPAAETPLEATSAPAEADAMSARRAAAHLRLALDAEGFPGAMIYSQNCFASLGYKFSWSKLDQCGAFDALVEVGSSGELGFGPEATYFEKSSSEHRFMAVASGLASDKQSIRAHFAMVQTAALARIPDLQEPVVVPSPAESTEVADLEATPDSAVDNKVQPNDELDRIFGPIQTNTASPSG